MVGIRRKEPTIPKKIYLSQELAGRVDLFLADPIRKKPKYAALSQLCEKLLSEYLDRAAALQPSPSLTSELLHSTPTEGSSHD